MKKRSFVFFVLSLSAVLFCTASLSAEGAPKKVLASADIDAFIAHFDAINTDLEALGDKYNNLFETNESDSPTVVMAKIRNIKVPSEIQAVLQKNGLGDNGFEKIMIISIGFAALEMESILQEQKSGEDTSLAPNQYIDQGLAQVNEIKASIHPDDLALLALKHEALYPILGNQYTGTPDDDTSGEAPDPDSYDTADSKGE